MLGTTLLIKTNKKGLMEDGPRGFFIPPKYGLRQENNQGSDLLPFRPRKCAAYIF